MAQSPTWRSRPIEDLAKVARERNRARGNPHSCCKSLELVQWLATLLRPPQIPDKPPPRLLVTYSGSGSEIVGGLLAGWKDILAIEHSEQWVELSRARARWWAKLLEAGAVPDVRALLGEGDEIHAALDPPALRLEGPLMRLFGDEP